MTEVRKKFMYLNRRAPYGTIYAQETLELILVAAAFEQTVSVAFIDDGVFQLMQNQEPSALGIKQFTKAFGALDDFDVANVYVESESMEKRGLKRSELIEICREDGTDMIQEITVDDLKILMELQDVVLQF